MLPRGTLWGTQPSPKRLAKNGVSERLFFDVLRSRRRKERRLEAIWQDGREREAREERTEHRGGKGGVMERRSPSPGKSRASRGNKEPARSERGAEAPGGRGPRPAGRPGCLIFCQPPLINGPPSSSERAGAAFLATRRAASGGGGACGKVGICTKCLGSAARRLRGGGDAGGGGQARRAERKGWWRGAAWVMGKFLWGAVLKISGYTPAARAAPPVAARRPGREGAGIGALLRPGCCAPAGAQALELQPERASLLLPSLCTPVPAPQPCASRLRP